MSMRSWKALSHLSRESVIVPRHFISKKELKNLKERVEALNLDTSALDGVEIEEVKDERCYFVNRKPYIYEKGKETVIPMLFFLNDIKPGMKYVSVDDGAVPHIMNGANVFAQGITDVDPEVEVNDMVFIRNKDSVYIGVGIAERSASDIMENKKGEAIRLIHFPNDKIFKMFYK